MESGTGEDDFDPLPLQGGGGGYEPTEEQRVPDHPDEGHRWVSWKERGEWQRQDLLDAIGAEFVAISVEQQPHLMANIPKRTSRQPGTVWPKAPRSLGQSAEKKHPPGTWGSTTGPYKEPKTKGRAGFPPPDHPQVP